MLLQDSKKIDVGTGLHRDIEIPHEQEWELYHNSFSICSKKVRICLDELGLPYKGHHVHLIETGSYETVSPSFLEINPKGTVPVLVHQGHPVYESHAQIAYAASCAGAEGERLRPSDPAKRARVDAWVDCASIVEARSVGAKETRARAGLCVAMLTTPLFATMVHYIPYREIWKGLLTHPYKERPLLFLTLRLLGIRGFPFLVPAMSVLRRARQDLGVHLDALSRELERNGGPWICGEDFTLADVSWAVLFDRLVEADWDRYFWAEPPRLTIAEYWDRLSRRGSIQRQLEDMRCEITRRGIQDLRDAKNRYPRLRRALEGA